MGARRQRVLELPPLLLPRADQVIERAVSPARYDAPCANAPRCGALVPWGAVNSPGEPAQLRHPDPPLPAMRRDVPVQRYEASTMRLLGWTPYQAVTIGARRRPGGRDEIFGKDVRHRDSTSKHGRGGRNGRDPPGPGAAPALGRWAIRLSRQPWSSSAEGAGLQQ